MVSMRVFMSGTGEGQDAAPVRGEGAHVFGAAVAIGDEFHTGRSSLPSHSAHSWASAAMSSGMVMPRLAAASEFTYNP